MFFKRSLVAKFGNRFIGNSFRSTQLAIEQFRLSGTQQLDGLADTMLRQPPAKVFDDLECVRSADGLAPPFDQCDGVIPGAFIISIGVTPEPRGGFLPYRLRPIHPPHSFNLELAVDLGEVN